MDKKHIIELDYVRAIATILVILGHCTYLKLLTDYGGVNYEPWNMSIIINSGGEVYKGLGLITALIYSFHMPLFIALSGLLWGIQVKSKELPKLKELLAQKAKRLLIPFFGVSLFWVIPLKYLTGYWSESGNGLQIISDMFMGQILLLGNASSHLWFLQALFEIFVFSWFIEKFKFRKYPMMFIPFLLILSISSYAGKFSVISVFSIPHAFVYLFWFYVGFYFSQYRAKANVAIEKHPLLYFIITLTCYLLCFYLSLHLHLLSVLSIGIKYLTTVLGIACIYIICYKLVGHLHKLFDTMLCWVSRFSYELYLYHDPIQNIVLFIVGKYFSFSTILANNVLCASLYLIRFISSLGGSILVIAIKRRVKCFFNGYAS